MAGKVPTLKLNLQLHLMFVEVRKVSLTLIAIPKLGSKRKKTPSCVTVKDELQQIRSLAKSFTAADRIHFEQSPHVLLILVIVGKLFS